MSTFLIALLLSLGVGGWVFGKAQRTTGGITQTSLLMAGAAFVVTFLFAFILAGFLPE